MPLDFRITPARFFDGHRNEVHFDLYDPEGAGMDRFRNALSGIRDVRRFHTSEHGGITRWEFPDGSAIVDNGTHVGLGVCNQNLICAEDYFREAEGIYHRASADQYYFDPCVQENAGWADIVGVPEPRFAIPDLLVFPKEGYTDYFQGELKCELSYMDGDKRLMGLEYSDDDREFSTRIPSMDHAGTPTPAPLSIRISGHHGVESESERPCAAKIALVFYKNSGLALEAFSLGFDNHADIHGPDMIDTVAVWRGAPVSLYEHDAQPILKEIEARISLSSLEGLDDLAAQLEKGLVLHDPELDGAPWAFENPCWGLNAEATDTLQEIKQLFTDQPLELPGQCKTAGAAEWVLGHETIKPDQSAVAICFDAWEDHNTRIFGGVPAMEAVLEKLRTQGASSTSDAPLLLPRPFSARTVLPMAGTWKTSAWKKSVIVSRTIRTLSASLVTSPADGSSRMGPLL